MVVLWYVFNRILCDQMTMMDAYAASSPSQTYPVGVLRAPRVNS